MALSSSSKNRESFFNTLRTAGTMILGVSSRALTTIEIKRASEVWSTSRNVFFTTASRTRNGRQTNETTPAVDRLSAPNTHSSSNRSITSAMTATNAASRENIPNGPLGFEGAAATGSIGSTVEFVGRAKLPSIVMTALVCSLDWSALLTSDRATARW